MAVPQFGDDKKAKGNNKGGNGEGDVQHSDKVNDLIDKLKAMGLTDDDISDIRTMADIKYCVSELAQDIVGELFKRIGIKLLGKNVVNNTVDKVQNVADEVRDYNDPPSNRFERRYEKELRRAYHDMKTYYPTEREYNDTCSALGIC